MTSLLNTSLPESLADDPADDQLALVARLGPVVDLRRLRAAVWRRWRVWVGVALAGAAIGAMFHLVVPARYKAVTELYLTEPAGSDPTIALSNETSLAQTTAVADRVISHFGLDMTSASLLASYQVVGVSPSIMSITASGSSPANAVFLANAVAKSFLHVRAAEFRLQNRIAVHGLQAEIASLELRANGLTKQISELSTNSGGSRSDQLTALVNERGSDDSQVSQLQAQLQQDQLNVASVVSGSTVLDPAMAVVVSETKVIAMDGLTGLALGLGMGLVGLVLALLLSDRIRSREELAAVVGAPVELSIPSSEFDHPRLAGILKATRLRLARLMNATGLSRFRLLEATLLRSSRVRPYSAERMVERRLRARLDSAPGAALAVVEVAAAEPSALAISLAARSLLSQNRRVVIGDMARGHPVAALLGISPTDTGTHTVNFGKQSATLIVFPEDPSELTVVVVRDDFDTTLVLATVDPNFTADHIAAWASHAVVIVDQNRAKGSQVSASAELLRQAGVTITSAILTGADSSDASAGVTGQAHFTSPGERPSGAGQPTRP